ncbi:MAG: nucleotidyl transferase AbiEii/AbiGii toxin family protein [Acidimicrobiia bacterium]
MFGDVTLIEAGDGGITRLVYTAATLFARPDFGPAALVGGLAVTMRLATVHRATNDVDAVSDGEAPLQYVGEDAAHGAKRIEIDGVKVDVMPTSPLPMTAEELPDGDLDRLFVLGHRWALESAEPVAVRVITTTESEPSHAQTLIVATAPALVACKFHAIADRRDARRDKRESDALDLVRLIADLVRAPAGAEQFADAPFDLAALVSLQAQRWLIEDATRTARLINLSAGAGEDMMNLANIATIGELFVEMCDHRHL